MKGQGGPGHKLSSSGEYNDFTKNQPRDVLGNQEKTVDIYVNPSRFDTVVMGKNCGTEGLIETHKQKGDNVLMCKEKLGRHMTGDGIDQPEKPIKATELGKGSGKLVNRADHKVFKDKSANMNCETSEKCAGTVKNDTKNISGIKPVEAVEMSYTDMHLSAEVIQKQKDIILSTWPETTKAAREKFPDFCAIYEVIREKGLPNFLGARIPVSSNLRIENWEKHLQLYHDKELLTFLTFGWPVGFHSNIPPTSVSENHVS